MTPLIRYKRIFERAEVEQWHTGEDARRLRFGIIIRIHLEQIHSFKRFKGELLSKLRFGTGDIYRACREPGEVKSVNHQFVSALQ